MLIARAALRTNLTMRELGACFAVSKSTAHRIVSLMTPQIAALAAPPTAPRPTRVVGRRRHADRDARSPTRGTI
jgi:hypothetical protein